MSATRQLFRAVSAPLARCHALHPNQPAKIQAQRTFFGGKNFDPFSDLHKALKELERTSKDIERQFQNVGRNLGIPRPIPIQGNLLVPYSIRFVDPLTSLQGIHIK